jgi:serine/threonine protein kinase
MISEDQAGNLEIKLIDFNVSKRFRDEITNNKLFMHTNTGAPAFTAPELHLKEAYK